MVKLLVERTPAKINLFLRVVGRRPDGYHLLDSLFVPISIYDQLRIELRFALTASVTLRCDRAGLPSDDRNLAVRAGALFLEAFGVRSQVLIDLEKSIPIGAGLGGGSSDAAAVLRLLASLCRIDEPARLATLALKLGADVPFFLNPQVARIAGIGEATSAFLPVPSLSLVIAAPPFEVSTAAVFRELRQDEWSGPAPDSGLQAIIANQFPPAVLVNDLTEPALRLHPEIAELKATLEAVGARAASMTGSGGAVFGIFDSIEQAQRAAREARRRLPRATILAASSIER